MSRIVPSPSAFLTTPWLELPKSKPRLCRLHGGSSVDLTKCAHRGACLQDTLVTSIGIVHHARSDRSRNKPARRRRVMVTVACSPWTRNRDRPCQAPPATPMITVSSRMRRDVPGSRCGQHREPVDTDAAGASQNVDRPNGHRAANRNQSPPRTGKSNKTSAHPGRWPVFRTATRPLRACWQRGRAGDFGLVSSSRPKVHDHQFWKFDPHQEGRVSRIYDHGRGNPTCWAGGTAWAGWRQHRRTIRGHHDHHRPGSWRPFTNRLRGTPRRRENHPGRPPTPAHLDPGPAFRFGGGKSTRSNKATVDRGRTQPPATQK